MWLFVYDVYFRYTKDDGKTQPGRIRIATSGADEEDIRDAVQAGAWPVSESERKTIQIERYKLNPISVFYYKKTRRKNHEKSGD